MTQERTQYEVVREYDGTFSLGEVIIPGVRLFKAGFYNLTKDQLDVLQKRGKKSEAPRRHSR